MIGCCLTLVFVGKGRFMGKTIKLTAKRQATFPAEVCHQLGLKSGDEMDLIPRLENGEQQWLLRKRTVPKRGWVGSLDQYALNNDNHSMSAIRESIARRKGVTQ